MTRDRVRIETPLCEKDCSNSFVIFLKSINSVGYNKEKNSPETLEDSFEIPNFDSFVFSAPTIPPTEFSTLDGRRELPDGDQTGPPVNPS